MNNISKTYTFIFQNTRISKSIIFECSVLFVALVWPLVSFIFKKIDDKRKKKKEELNMIKDIIL